MQPTGNQADRWAHHADDYRTVNWGVIDPGVDPADHFVVESGVPYFDANENGKIKRVQLTEIEVGLFMAANGEMLDLRGLPPTWRFGGVAAVSTVPRNRL